MPLIDRIIIRASLVYLMAGVVLGAVLLGYRYGAGTDPFPSAQSVHLHLLLVGWLVQLVVGVAHWLLPRPRGATPGWVLPALGFVLLNIGLLLRAVVQPLVADRPELAGALIAAGVLQAVAIIIFALTLWSRLSRPRTPRTPDRG